MGCDIHEYTEVRGADGRWTSVDRWEPDEDDEKRLTVPWRGHFIEFDRNYGLFAILADVRNGRGRKGEKFVPIAAPRDLPEDCDPRVRAESEHYGVDGHSHSYVTVRELLDYDWTQVVKHGGYVTGVEFAGWDDGTEWCRRAKGEGPESWCEDVGGGVAKVSEADMRTAVLRILKQTRGGPWSLTEDALREQLGSTYCRIQWEAPYWRSARQLWHEFIPKALRLGKPEDVRLVFFFDN